MAVPDANASNNEDQRNKNEVDIVGNEAKSRMNNQHQKSTKLDEIFDALYVIRLIRDSSFMANENF
jgi:hypothetical protein